MRNLLGSLLLTTTLTACGGGYGGGGGGGSQTSGLRELAASIDPLPTSGANVSGTADIKWNVGDALFTATAAITGDIPGAVRPWHVHFGVCPHSGEIVGPAGSYPALVADQFGAAEITTTVAFELDASVPYSVNVHESQSALANVIACGDLEVIAGGGGGGGGGGDDDGGGGGY